MTGPLRLTDLVNLRRQGALDRDAYWAAMQALHQGLAEYRQLVAAARIAALEVTPEALVIRLADGTRFAWDPADRRAPPVVLLNEGSYEPMEWVIVRTLGVAGRTVLDVGAHIGWYTVRLAEQRGSRAGLHAFEPVPSTYRQLAANIRLNGFEDRVVIHPLGLSDRDETVSFFMPADTGSVAASERVLFESERQSVTRGRVRRLDDVSVELGLDDIDFVKCDIEGGEFGFLRGAERVLGAQRPTVLLEMLRKWSDVYGYHPNDIIEWMKLRGYVCAAVSGGSVVRIDMVTEATEPTNYLFVHRDRRAEVATILRQEVTHVALD